MLKMFVGAIVVAALATDTHSDSDPVRPAPVPEQVVGYGPDVCTPIHYRSLDLAGLARESEAIVVADVTGIACRWLDRMIWTDTRLSVRECWKGDLDGTIVVSEPGGVIHPVGATVAGVPSYRQGTRVAVFLSRDVLGQRRALGAVQGVFPVVTVAGIDRVDVTAVPRPTVARHFAGAPEARAALPALEDFHAVVSALAGRGEGR